MLDAAKNVGDPKPYLGNRAVQWGKIDVSAAGVVPMTRSDLRRYRLRRGDLLVCEGGEVGRAAVWQDELPECYFQKALHRLRPKAGYDVRLMLAFLEYWASVGAFTNYVTQTSIAHLPRDKFIQMLLPVPHVLEQERLGGVVDDLNRQIGALERLIAKKLAIKQGAIQELLTGKSRLPGFRYAWEHRRVTEMGDVLAGKALNVRGAGALRPYLRTKNVLDGQIDLEDVLWMPMTDAEFERFHLERGDVLLNEGQSLELVGRCSVYNGEFGAPCTMQNQLLRFRAYAGTSPEFAAQLFRQCQRSGVFAAIATQTTSVAHLGSSRLSNLHLLWPTDRLEQAAIAEVLSDMDAEVTALGTRLNKARAVKQGMMQQLLTGKTRLPVAEAA
jgi:type I restriction enzyme S subunit